MSIVIFDSSVPIDSGQAVYMSGTAREVDDARLEELVEVFSRRSLGHGGGPFAVDDVRPPARLRLYRQSRTSSGSSTARTTACR